MGTDIHPVVQILRDGRWVDVEDRGPLVDGKWPALRERNYRLFAVLANVRNGFGFAGVYTHEPLRVISEPRGLPDGFELHDGHYHGSAPSEYKDEPLGRWMGDHDYSWVTLAELEAYEWAAPLQRGGVTKRGTPRDENGRPHEWSGAVFGKDEDQYERVEWTEPVRRAVEPFCSLVMPWLRSLGKPDEVRLVFGFDS